MTNLDTYSSPLLSRPSAQKHVDGSLIDAAGVAWHYGEPLAEQRRIETGPVVVDRSHRRVIKITGEDAAEFLNNLLTQKLDDASAGFSAACLDLDIQGRILHQGYVTRTDDAFYLDTPSYCYPTFIDFLQKMIFWSKVEITEANLGILTLLGDLSTLDDDALSDLPTVFERHVDWDGVPRHDVAVPRDQLEAVVEKLEARGVVLAGLMAFTAERVRAGEPEMRADLDEKSIPHEAPRLINRPGRVRAVHLEKGCYRGQETVGRVENLGRSPRLLVLLQLDGSVPEDPVPGSHILANGRKSGRLGTVVHDRDYGPIALALLKRNAVQADELIIEGESTVSATVDRDYIPEEETTKPGREAIAKLRGQN
ncbi:CAF17-like 4Fe-4S cluster assembly/insertion protein YgfZ [Corynebacterium cystitidis]|uniref:CAF17-like 4Fe-4S cluster assembly/insertion protein YgfZ n=1 Tax=Corynebacterium cystitidis TaxID=35757 RepID=UPI00211E3070|nr:folate-binding protein [Corynebacterium cystitidis]